MMQTMIELPDALNFEGLARRANYRIIAFREDILIVFDRKDAAAIIYNILERWEEVKRDEIIKEIERRRTKNLPPLTDAEIEDRMWVYMSYNDFARESGGAVTYNTVIAMLKYLIQDKKAISQRPNHDPHYPDYEYHINRTVMVDLLKALPVKPPTYTKSGTTKKKKKPYTKSGTPSTENGTTPTNSGIGTTENGTGVYQNWGTSHNYSHTTHIDHTEGTYGVDANAQHTPAQSFIYRHDFNGRSFYYHDLCNQQQDRGCNEGMTFTLMRSENVPQDAQCDICYQPIHGLSSNSYSHRDTGNHALLENESDTHSHMEVNHDADDPIQPSGPSLGLLAHELPAGTRPAAGTPDTAVTRARGSSEVAHDPLSQPSVQDESVLQARGRSTAKQPFSPAAVAQGTGEEVTQPKSAQIPTDGDGVKKATDEVKKPARTSKKVIPFEPPQMPADDAPWTAETFVQVLEARQGRRYPNGAKRASDRVRDKELASATELVAMDDLWAESTAENKYRLLKIADHHENRKEHWFLDNVGRVMPHHLLKDDNIHQRVDELIRLKKAKQANGHSVSGRRNFTYEQDTPKEEAPLPYKIVPQQSPRKIDFAANTDEQPRRRLRLHRVTPLIAAAQPGM